MTVTGEDVRGYCERAWPYQFREASDQTKGTATAEDIEYTGRRLRKLVEKGVGWDQIMAALVAMRNEPSGNRLDRGTIVRKLWDSLAPPSYRAPEPEVTEPVVRMCPNPMRVAMQQANGNAERAVDLYPWLGEECEMPSGRYRRRIDAPYYRVQLEAHNNPLPKISGKVGFASGEEHW